MKPRLSTTALVVALGCPVLTLAQETAPAANPAQRQSVFISGFLAAHGQSDIKASLLMGHGVFARSMPHDAAARGDTRIDGAEFATERFMGEAVHDGNDADVGTATDMIIDDAGIVAGASARWSRAQMS
jgi:hypothetical protein